MSGRVQGWSGFTHARVSAEALLRGRILDFVNILRGVELEVRPYSLGSEQLLRTASLEDLTSAYEGLGAYIHLLTTCRNEKGDMRSSRQLTWSALKILGLRPPLDFFDKIQNEDIVEIYNTDQVQIFRTLRFFELCSYDVASILMIPWYKLYGRSSQMEEIGLREMNDSLFSGTAAVPFDMPSHELSEIASAEMRVFEMRHRWRGPLMGRDANGNMSRQGIIMTSAAKRLR